MCESNMIEEKSTEILIKEYHDFIDGLPEDDKNLSYEMFYRIINLVSEYEKAAIYGLTLAYLHVNKVIKDHVENVK